MSTATTELVSSVRTASEEFREVVNEAMNASTFMDELRELRRRELADLINTLDEVRECVAEFLGWTGEEVDEFSASSTEFHEAVAAIACAGEPLYQTVRDLRGDQAAGGAR